jgi:hypothetical protein
MPGGRNAPPRPPAPLRGVVRALRPRRGAMPATASQPAPLRTLARRAPGSRRRPAGLSAHGLRRGAGAPRAGFLRAPPPWGAVVRPAAAPWLAARSRLAPAAAGRRAPHRARAGSYRGRGSHDAFRSFGLAPRSRPVLRAVRSSGPGSTSSPRPAPLARSPAAAGGTASKQGSKGGLVPPWTPQPSAYGARQRARRPGPTRGFRSQPHAGAGVRPAAHRWHHGRRLVLRAVRSSGSGSAAGASARAPRSGVGVNPARFAPRRCAAGCAGGLTPPPDRGSGWWSPRRAVRPAPFPTGAGRGSRSAHAITGNSYASPGRRGLDAGPRSAPSGRLRDSGDRSPRGSTASKQGGRAAPLGPPARMARAGQAATEWSHTGAIAPRPCRACQPGGAGSRHESGRRGQPLPAPCVTLR